MKKTAGIFVAVFVLIGFVLMAAGYAQTAEDKGKCSNPIKETIDKTASIKEMQSQPAPALTYKHDVLGNRLPDQTDNSGKITR